MTQENYSAKTADLIEDSFKALRAAMGRVTEEERQAYAIQADVTLKAAQAIATLAAARETRILAYATLAAVPSQSDADAQVAREAFAMAAVGLGLVEDVEEDGAPTLDQLREALAGKGDDGESAEDDHVIDRLIADGLLEHGDPADADLGDLK